MRKVLYIFIIMVISFVFLTACRDTESKSNKKIEQNQETFTNKKTDIPFSDKIFDNIVKIETGKTYPLQEIKNKAVIQNICGVLKELKLTEIEDPKIDGGDIMKFIYEDGTEKQFAFTSEYILYDNVMYYIGGNQGNSIYDIIRTDDK